MELIKLALLVTTVAGIAGFAITWVQAYGKIKDTQNKHQQIAVLQPWWFLDKSLLPKECEYIRFRAVKFFFLYSVPLVLFVWVVE